MSVAIVTANSAPATWEFMGRDMESAGRLAKALVATGLAPQGMTAASAFYVLLAGAELRLRGPIEALRHVQVIKGKVAVSAELMRAMMLEQGCEIEWPKLDSTCATIRITRPNGKPQEFSFTKDDAVRAHLWGKGGWETYPTAMLMARATSLGARAACPDMLRGASFTPEELGAPVTFTDDGEMAYVTDVTLHADDDPEPNGNGKAQAPPALAETNGHEPTEEKASAAQVKALAILTTKKLGAIERGPRLRMFENVVMRELESTSDLTATEWRACIDMLNTMPDAPKKAAAPETAVATAEEDDADPHGLFGDETDAQKITRLATAKKQLDSEGFLVINPRAGTKWGLPSGTWAVNHLVDQGHAEKLIAMLEA